jgi:YD repeat-containing protein
VGLRTLQVSAEDPTGKGSNTYQTYTRVDRTPPEVTLSGQLAQATNEGGSEEKPPGEGDELTLPVYNLAVDAEDGSNAEDKTKRSGVKDIRIFLDGAEQEVPWPAQSCPASSCAMSQTYTLKLSNLTTAGEHVLDVKVEDQVGNVRDRHVEFEYFPATGMKDEYVMHYFPLPDGQGNEEEEEHPARPELAVNVMNGNLVYRERDIDVEGPAVDLEVERFYNSQLPSEENSEWGDGWTLAQTPDLKPEEEANPSEAELLDASGAVDEEVALPTVAEEAKFDPELQATLTKKQSGGYELTDETGESVTSVAFDETGQAEALVTDGPAKVDYSYESGDLAEITAIDPATTKLDPEEAQELEPEAPEGPTYASSLGSSSPGDGHLYSPGDVAVDAQGDVWVVDKGANRIQKFGPGGEFLAKFGTWGSGNGQFNRPTAIAIASNGDLLITDAGNSRVQRFSSTGAFISAFGSKGFGPGQFAGAGPEGIAIDAEDHVWVSDTYAGRLQEFSATGEFLRTVGSYGSGDGEIGEPTGIDFDAGGNVWVADWENSRIEVFDSEGQFLDQFGSRGTGDGQFKGPDALDIDDEGNVWVGDQENSRIQRFDLAGQYVGQFGSPGSGEGQFDFFYPMGIDVDAGHIWITDVKNDRVQEWVMPGTQELFTAYEQTLGSVGAGEGELEAPADVAIDDEGGLWVADKGNNRIEHFDADGNFVSQFGSTGSGDGQINAPSGIDLDPEGNVWVADTGNDRIQKFSPEGEFLLKIGASGSGNGQFDEPVGIAYSPGLAGVGAVYVADRGNNRIQLFGKGGGYWGQAGSYGSGEKQLIEPSAIALGGPSGESGFMLLIADSGNHRIQRWTWNGEFVTQFGTLGTGKGQLNHPEAIDVDEQGTVWVGDRVNDRVEVFDEDGKILGEFGSPGTGEGQFELTYPIGIAAANGEVWVTDSGNDRLQRWQGFLYSPKASDAPVPEDDPVVEVETPGGLVSAVEGEEAGAHEYVHGGELLVSHDGPVGETAYEYDEADRLSKVTLPNGTWGSIAYFADGRVKDVTVDPAGEEPAKTTHFTYKDDSPRRTTVEPEDAPHVVYDIGDDGSVLKWWNAQEPPLFDDMAGTLYDQRETPEPIEDGDKTLSTQAYSPEGISSIEVIANGTDLVDERICEQDPEKEGIECETVVNEWVTNTNDWSPGHVFIEVLITDRLGQSASERFWVNTPQPPPPPAPGTPVAPTYAEIAKFREEYGLEVIFPVKDEVELNERIFDLIGAWHNPQTPAGEVARASWERWGVPLRPDDIAELEYRDYYLDVNGELIENWANANASSTYAGYYMDHRAGGILRVGFTQDQIGLLSALKSSTSLKAVDRIDVPPSAPAVSLASLVAANDLLAEALDENAALSNLVAELGVNESTNSLSIGAIDVAQAESVVEEMLGSQIPVDVYQVTGVTPASGRNRTSGRMRAGDRIVEPSGWCTAAFGAFEERNRKSDGARIMARFLLSAGHCFALDSFVYRSSHGPDDDDSEDWSPVGQVTRNALHGTWGTDGLAVRVKAPNLVPHGIFGSSGNLIPTRMATKARPGNTLCFSGARLSGVSCGQVTQKVNTRLEGVRIGAYNVRFNTRVNHGDSGAPVWNPRTGAAIGVITGFYPDTGISAVTPLLHPKGLNGQHVPGILHDSDMYSLHLITG